ncbi:MAG: SDR family NAD(P)-dependent oxidoreductase [Myxococcota bacterium]|nr:SDR family NAD(P)-dependent oxidoreductase [Myxococcota bacterium]
MNTDKPCALVTGASRGLGLGLCQSLLEEGYSVGACSHSRPIPIKHPQCIETQFDITDESSLTRFTNHTIETFGKISLWINNAGILDPICPVREMTHAAFEQAINVNLKAVFLASKLFINHVRNQRHKGLLINISSGAAQKPYAHWGAYCATKAAMERLTTCIAEEELESGLRAISLSPGVINTDMQTQIRKCSEEQFPMVQKFHDIKAKNAFNTPAQVARYIIKIHQDVENSDIIPPVVARI